MSKPGFFIRFLRKHDLHIADNFIAYVERRNFHPEVEAFYSDMDIFETCPAFGKAV